MIKLSEILFEENKYKKETGEKLPNWQEKLKTYEASKEYFVHFSNVPRVALYIINKFDTPIGFYAYPLDFNKMENFAVSRPYAIVFKTKPDAKMPKPMQAKTTMRVTFTVSFNEFKPCTNSLE